MKEWVNLNSNIEIHKSTVIEDAIIRLKFKF